MKNNYGNYVVQKALRISTGLPKLKLIISILKNIEKIGEKKLIAKWRNIVISCLPNENEMNNIDGELIYKLLRSNSVDENQTINRNLNQNYLNSNIVNHNTGKFYNFLNKLT